ncbi:hypothetical protein B9G55_13250 [Saccharibacillus sp. O16]|nr:hypothetical protein B9G55_13250 [Saccharibacillus sp. O16]
MQLMTEAKFELLCQPADQEHQTALRQLTELYKYDFTEYDPEDVNEEGRYEYRDLDAYWNKPGHYPFLLRADGQLAGFALIRRFLPGQSLSLIPFPVEGEAGASGEDADCNATDASRIAVPTYPPVSSGSDSEAEYGHEIVEFFVMKKYRRVGLGRLAAQQLFRRFSGVWKLGIMEENEPALAFWRRAIADCKGASTAVEICEPDWDGPVLVFKIL